VADSNDSKKGAHKPRADRPDPENLGPPVGAAADTSAQRSPPVAPVVIGGDSFVDKVLPHVPKIIAGGVALAVVLIAYFSWDWWKESKAAAGTDELAEAFDLLHRPIDPPAPAPIPGAEPGTPPEPAPKAAGALPSYPTRTARAEAVVAALGKTELDPAGRLLEANLLLQTGKLDQAEAVYRTLTAGSALENILAREGLGYVAEAKAAAAKDPAERQKLLEAALAAFRAIQPDDKGPRRDYALYHEARILTLLDQRAEARAALDKALVVVPDSAIELDIQQRLAQLEATGAP
jgi:tetratricopeptide (TPR) repeat protein